MGNSKRPFANRNIFQTIDTEEKAYWLGFLYADGSVGSTDNRIELTLAQCDYNHLVKFKNFIGLDNKIAYREKIKAYRYVFKDQGVKSDLIKLGCIPKKSLVLTFPTEQQVPPHLLRHFMRGYFDGDGCFCNTNSCFEAGILGTEKFITGFIAALPNSINKTLTIKSGCKNATIKKYGVYSYYDVLAFLNFLYQDCTIFLDRKYEKYLDFIQNGSKYHKTKKV